MSDMKKIDDSVENRYFGDTAKLYDDERFTSLGGKYIDRLEKKAILALLDSVKDIDSVLDIPCGTGRITQILLDKGFRVTGADISIDMIKLAGMKTGKYDNLSMLAHCDLTNLPFQDERFDYVTSIRLMGHVPQTERVKMLKEMRRVTKRGIIISYYNPNTVKGVYRELKSNIKRPNTKWYPITPRKLYNEISQANLQIIKKIPILRWVAETFILLLQKDTNEPHRVI